MIQKIVSIYFVTPLWVFIVSCSTGNLNQLGATKFKVEDFNSFHKRFYTDSIFQNSRIVYPLEGFNANVHEEEDNLPEDTIPKTYYTQKGELGLLVPVPANDPLLRVELKQSDTVAVERIWIPDSGFTVEMRYKPKGKKWHLVYFNYSDT